MNIFISHSSTDKPLVDALAVLLKAIFGDSVQIPRSTASVAEGGIRAGTSWLEWIRDEVTKSNFVIVVLTPRSVIRPWLLWEAGAATGVAVAREQKTPIVPLLYSLSNEEVPSPLSSRQTIDGNSDSDMADLIESIRLEGAKIEASDDEMKTAVQTYLDDTRPMGIPGMYDLFVSCPMSSVDENEYEELQDTIETLSASMAKDGRRAYSAALRVKVYDDMDQENIAAEEDFAALQLSRNFMMIYPRAVVTSCLLEAGYALVSGIPSMYFVRNVEELPYMLRGAMENSLIVAWHKYKQPADVLKFYARYPDRLFK